MATKEKYAQAGSIAAAWFERMQPQLERARTAARHDLENELLDAALMDAGIIAPELPAPPLVGGTTLTGQAR